MKRFICLVLFVLFASAAFAEPKRFDVPASGSPVLGPPDAPVTVIEFIDYQ